MSAIAYTDEQRAALETRHVPVTVDAGAGCGKTFVLTERFLSHLDPGQGDPGRGDQPPAELEELVAITFTDAAAREMRDRIRGKCRERLLAADSESAPFWRRLLRSLDGARVSTIHAFASGLIRDNAIELGVDPAFAVLEPAEAEVLKTRAVDDTLRGRLTPREGGLDEALADAAAQLDLAPLRAAVRTLVGSADAPRFAAWASRSPDQAVAAWLAYYQEHVAPAYAREVLADPQVVELRELLSVATPDKPEFVQRVGDLGEALDLLAESHAPDAELKRLQELLAYYLPGTRSPVYGAKDWPDKESKARFTEVRKALLKRLEDQRRSGDPDAMRRAAELGLEVHRLAHDAAKRYRAAKRDRGVLDNDDLLIEAHRLLTSPALEEVRARVAGWVRVLLVDEFQDTDRLQAELVAAIAGDSAVSEGEPDATGQGGRSFLVGDFKQSIYRFRGAVPEVFGERRAATPEAGRLTLSRNFRSTPEVLRFVNTLFAPIFGDGYTALEASRPQLAPGPAVEMLWAAPPSESATAPQRRRAEAASLAGRIRELIDSGEPCVVDRGATEARGARPGDFALLFRSLSNVALYEEALREAGLDYYLVGGHAFYAQQEVYDVLNLLRSLESGCDDIALAGALRSPLFGLTDEALFWLARSGGSLGAGLFADGAPAELDAAAARVVEHARRVLMTLREAKDRVGAAELLRRAWELTGYDATLLADFLGGRKLANLEKIHEQARQADASGAGLRGLVARLREFVDTPPKEALAATTAVDAGVVRLMTVHASKGLEFPIVALADLNSRTRNDTTTVAYDPELGPLIKPPAEGDDRKKAPPVGLDFWKATEKPREEAERDRLFYVACTRAADRLILSATLDPAEGKVEGPWLKRLSERFDLVTGELAGEGDPLVAVTPPPARASGEGTSGVKRRLGDALEAARAGLSAPQPKGDAAPIAVDPAAVRTFSVSRLSGRLSTHGGVPNCLPDEEVPSRVDPRRLGTLVHDVIERLDPAAEEWGGAVDGLVESLAPRHLRRSIASGVSQAKQLARRFVATREWDAMRLSPDLRREVEFLLPWPSAGAGGEPALLRGYLDALYRDADGAWRLVDYKTNKVDAAGVPRLAEQYALQMSVYAHAVEAATGERPASLTLVFLAAGVSHTLAWDEAAHAESIIRINEAIAAARREFPPLVGEPVKSKRGWG